tara:strand:+ start:255 stop:1277 length:1023 start_codon:yes stop_codon:yes gene_type:complete
MKTTGIFLIKNGKSETAFKEIPYSLSSLKDDEVLIEVEAFGLNYAEVMARNGLYQDCPELPCILGYEAVGNVVECKNNKALIGKRVLAFCRFGAYSKHVITKENAIIEINDINCDDALALCTQGVTAYYMAHFLSPIKKDDHVLIHAAAGGVGSILIQLAKINGGIVYAKVGGIEKEATAKKLGADYVINYKKNDYANELTKLLKNKKLDAVFNPVGGTTFKKDFNLLDSGGRIYLYGASELMRSGWKVLNVFRFLKKMGILLPVKLISTSKSIIGVNMLRIADNKPTVMQECLLNLTKLYNEKLLKPEIGKTFNTSQISEAHKFLESGKSTGKIVIRWD